MLTPESRITVPSISAAALGEPVWAGVALMIESDPYLDGELASASQEDPTAADLAAVARAL